MHTWKIVSIFPGCTHEKWKILDIILMTHMSTHGLCINGGRGWGGGGFGSYCVFPKPKRNQSNSFKLYLGYISWPATGRNTKGIFSEELPETNSESWQPKNKEG